MSTPKKSTRQASDVEIIYPPGYRHTISPTPEVHRGAYTGTSWANSTLRPDCLAHEGILSRRGDEYVVHRPALTMQTSSPRGPASRVLADLRRIVGGRC